MLGRRNTGRWPNRKRGSIGAQSRNGIVRPVRRNPIAPLGKQLPAAWPRTRPFDAETQRFERFDRAPSRRSCRHLHPLSHSRGGPAGREQNQLTSLGQQQVPAYRTVANAVGLNRGDQQRLSGSGVE